MVQTDSNPMFSHDGKLDEKGRKGPLRACSRVPCTAICRRCGSELREGKATQHGQALAITGYSRN